MVSYSSVKAHSRSRCSRSLIEPRVSRKFSAEPSGISGLDICASNICVFSSSLGIIVVNSFYTANSNNVAISSQLSWVESVTHISEAHFRRQSIPLTTKTEEETNMQQYSKMLGMVEGEGWPAWKWINDSLVWCSQDVKGVMTMTETKSQLDKIRD